MLLRGWPIWTKKYEKEDSDNDGNVIFEGSGVEMSEKTVEYIKKNAAKYLVDVTKLF